MEIDEDNSGGGGKGNDADEDDKNNSGSEPAAAAAASSEKDAAVSPKPADGDGEKGDDAAAATTTADANDATESASGKKRSRSSSESSGTGGKAVDAAAAAPPLPPPEAKKQRDAPDPTPRSANTREAVADQKIPVASIAAASQLSASMGWNGLASLLSLSLLVGSNSGGGSGASSSSSSGERSGSLGRISSQCTVVPAGSSGGGGGKSGNTGSLPSPDQVRQASVKAVNDAPPFVHLSKTDSAPQLKIIDSVVVPADGGDGGGGGDEEEAHSVGGGGGVLTNDRLACKQGKGEMRGYRMARASHGVAPGSGTYYYEVVILEPPTARELVESLPPNIRLAKKLQRQMQEALRAEEEEEQAERRREKQAKLAADDSDEKAAAATGGGEATNEKPPPPSQPAAKPTRRNGGGGSQRAFGAHVRLGWSMRTGDLQAPVGYDKWSYGIRDILGSKIHCSNRNDNWGGEEFGPGDVVGCAISMVSDGSEAGGGGDAAATANEGGSAQDPQQQQQQQQQKDPQQPKAHENHIRFFKNGLPMGEFVITKGKREGGAAFIIPDGVYYPAVSLYMGATVKVNFGPHFVFPPRKLPAGLSLARPGAAAAGAGGKPRKGVIRPISDLVKVPLSVEESADRVSKEQKALFFNRKADATAAPQKRFLELVTAEATVQAEAYASHRRKHVRDVREERRKRNLKTDDLEQDGYAAAKTTEAAASGVAAAAGASSS